MSDIKARFATEEDRDLPYKIDPIIQSAKECS